VARPAELQVVDFVGKGGATVESVAMLPRAGNYYVVGYGENINVLTIDIVSTEINSNSNRVWSAGGASLIP